MNSNHLICPNCQGNQLMVKYEASYIYSYLIDSDAPGTKNTTEFLPFLYDNREQKETKQYIECSTCHAKFPCVFNQWDQGASLAALRHVLSNNNQ